KQVMTLDEICDPFQEVQPYPSDSPTDVVKAVSPSVVCFGRNTGGPRPRPPRGQPRQRAGRLDQPASTDPLDQPASTSPPRPARPARAGSPWPRHPANPSPLVAAPPRYGSHGAADRGTADLLRVQAGSWSTSARWSTLALTIPPESGRTRLERCMDTGVEPS